METATAIAQFDHVLLTIEDEHTLGTTVRKWRDSPSPTEEDIKAGEAARERLIISNQRLVNKIANDFVGAFGDRHKEDLMSEGNIGLMIAAERYDPVRGTKFSYYSSFWIKQRMLRYARESIGIIRYPNHRYHNRQQIRETILEYREKHGVNPDAVTISELTKIPLDHVEVLLETCNEVVSIDVQVSGRQTDNRPTKTVGDDLKDPTGESPMDSLVNKDNLDVIIKVIGCLTARERDVIKRRFGFSGEMETLDQVGQTYDLTRERIRQIEEAALRKIKLLLAKYNVHLNYAE